MLLSPAQIKRFWREWSAACKAQQWPASETEPQRKALLQRAGFSSLTTVDQGKGFTAVLKELAILQDNLKGMLRADANERRQVTWMIQHSDQVYGLGHAYWEAIALSRFRTTDLDQLTDAQLVQLRNTLADRAVEEHHRTTKILRAEKRKRTHLSAKASATADHRVKFGGKDLVPAHPNPDQQSTRALEEPELEQAAVGACDESNPF
jgi:hypothetical protein